MQDTALMLHTLLELGESMLADGADVRRVEQTLTRMGRPTARCGWTFLSSRLASY